jgi:PKD repeat protein
LGKPVRFSAVIEAPPNTGKVVLADWDFDGSGNFTVSGKVNPGAKVILKATHAFANPGTYFVTLRVASQRDGDTSNPYPKILNLDRVRVVVK